MAAYHPPSIHADVFVNLLLCMNGKLSLLLSKGSQKELRRDQDFRLKHFAGDVTYCVDGFLDKNKDTLFMDIKRLFYNSKNTELKAMWPDGAASKTEVTKRPPTAGTVRGAALGVMSLSAGYGVPGVLAC